MLFPDASAAGESMTPSYGWKMPILCDDVRENDAIAPILLAENQLKPQPPVVYQRKNRTSNFWRLSQQLHQVLCYRSNATAEH
jgi:hypothetical protein